MAFFNGTKVSFLRQGLGFGIISDFGFLWSFLVSIEIHTGSLPKAYLYRIVLKKPVAVMEGLRDKCSSTGISGKGRTGACPVGVNYFDETVACLEANMMSKSRIWVM